jgi:hypothetical protein
VIVYLWIAQIFAYCSENQLLRHADSILPRFQKAITKMRGSGADIFMFLNTQLPYCYIQLLSFAVHVFMFAITCQTGQYINTGVNMATYGSILKTGTVFWGYLEMCILTMVFEGLLVLNCMIENPWISSRSAGFPVDKYRQDLLLLTNCLIQKKSNELMVTVVIDSTSSCNRNNNGTSSSHLRSSSCCEVHPECTPPVFDTSAVVSFCADQNDSSIETVIVAPPPKSSIIMPTTTTTTVVHSGGGGGVVRPSLSSRRHRLPSTRVNPLSDASTAVENNSSSNCSTPDIAARMSIVSVEPSPHYTVLNASDPASSSTARQSNPRPFLAQWY